MQMQTAKSVRICEYQKVSNICTLSVRFFLFKDPGIIRKAVDHLFYSIEETPDRYFLMQVSKRFLPEEGLFSGCGLGSGTAFGPARLSRIGPGHWVPDP